MAAAANPTSMSNPLRGCQALASSQTLSAVQILTELGLPIQDRASIAGMFDFTKASLGSEVALRLQDDIPLIQLVASLGYHFGEGKPYLGFSAEFGRHYFVTVRHIWKADTQLGIGLKANTF